MKPTTTLKLIPFLTGIIILSGFNITANIDIPNKNPTTQADANSQPLIDSLDPNYQLGCKNESVFIKHSFEEMNGIGYYILVPIEQNERSILTNVKEFIKYWGPKILSLMKQYQIENEVYEAIELYFQENEMPVENNITKIKLITSSNNYDTIEFQLIQNDYFVYTISLNYYSPL